MTTRHTRWASCSLSGTQNNVDPVIAGWFADRPALGAELAGQIAGRPDLQQAVTVPLILAFCCILSGGDTLPEFRHELLASVINRMLTGRWRDSDGGEADVGTCLEKLRSWAWSGASGHPVTGLGTWDDVIRGEDGPLSPADRAAFDHVAPRVIPRNIDTGMSARSFAHRSLQEHLVAERVASLGIDEATEVLLPHLWFDPDWEHAAPAAIAMHPQRDELLRQLLSRAARSGQPPTDLSVIDAEGEVCALLSRVASESRPGQWAPDTAKLISQARMRLAQPGHTTGLGWARSWRDANRRARQVLLSILTTTTDCIAAAELASALPRLSPTSSDSRRARDAVLRLLARLPPTRIAVRLADALNRLGPTAEDRIRARHCLTCELVRDTGSADEAADLIRRIALMSPTASEASETRRSFVEILAGGIDEPQATQLVLGIVRLRATGQAARDVMASLLDLLDSQTDRWGAGRLVDGLVGLAASPDDKNLVRQRLLRLLSGSADDSVAAEAAIGVIRLNPTSTELMAIRRVILSRLANATLAITATELAAAAARLPLDEADLRYVRAALLNLLEGLTDGWGAPGLARALSRFRPATADRLRARRVIIRLVEAQQQPPAAAAGLVGCLAELYAPHADRRQVISLVLGSLAPDPDLLAVSYIVPAVMLLNPTATEKRRIREILLDLLSGTLGSIAADRVLELLITLSPTAADKRQARAVLVSQWDSVSLLSLDTLATVRMLMKLSPTAAQTCEIRCKILDQLATDPDHFTMLGQGRLATVLDLLGTTRADRCRVRRAVLDNITEQSGSLLTRVLADLSPEITELTSMHFPSTLHFPAELLAACRKTSDLSQWLDALPLLGVRLATESRQAKQTHGRKRDSRNRKAMPTPGSAMSS